MAVARVEHDRAVARAVRGKDQAGAPRQKMPDRRRRPFGHDDRIELPQERQRTEQDRQAGMANDRAVAQPAADPPLSQEFDARGKARIGRCHLLDHAQMSLARHGHLDIGTCRCHFGGDRQRVEYLVRFANEQEENTHYRLSVTAPAAASSKSAARQPCCAASRAILSPRPTSQTSFARANVAASLIWSE